jgi:hypothetical protein
MPDRVPWQRNNQFDQWYKMVTAYTILSLTYTSDVLSALSGLESAIAQTHGCTYLAGLWKEDLQIGLAWYVQWHDTDYLRQAIVRDTDHESFNLPTWSWAFRWGNYIGFQDGRTMQLTWFTKVSPLFLAVTTIHPALSTLLAAHKKDV